MSLTASYALPLLIDILPFQQQILRATHKISEHAFISHETKKLNPWLFSFAILTALNSALRINW